MRKRYERTRKLRFQTNTETCGGAVGIKCSVDVTPSIINFINLFLRVAIRWLRDKKTVSQDIRSNGSLYIERENYGQKQVWS